VAATTTPTGSAERWGRAWGARPRDWAVSEEQQAPTYDTVADRVGLTAGQRVLEIGCGTGVFLRRAVDRGAKAFGLDASEALVELARSRVPEADIRVGEMQALPYESASFDVVAGFNAFFFAADMVEALREAGRVAKPGAPVAIQVWGDPSRCDLTAMKHALAELAPPPPASTPAAPGLWEPGVLEVMATAAGLKPEDAFDFSWAFEFPDEESLAAAMLAVGLVTELLAIADEADVRRAIVSSLQPYRTSDGSYRLANEWHALIARA
jgi:SAM-dependent methyltransferase